MIVNQKYQYALRAIYELAKHIGKGPIKISNIAKAQAIPLRFLEVILNQLKHSGLVNSKRGYYGGYFLIKNPEDITVGEIFRHMGQQFEPVACISCSAKKNCPFEGHCAFFPMWDRVHRAIFNVFDTTTIQGLLESKQPGTGPFRVAE
jgi:Rrf2 family protein